MHAPPSATVKEKYRVYIGPDTLMPIASVFAAVAGFVMMFWRRLVGVVKLLVEKMSGRQSRS